MGKISNINFLFIAIFLLCITVFCRVAKAEDKADLAKAAQNPIADMLNLNLHG